MTSTDAIIYTRISRTHDSTDTAGVDRQAEDCRELAAARGLTVVGEYVDNDVSAYSRKPRAGWQQAVRALEEGHAQVLVAWHTDRLYRRTRDLEDVLDVVEGHGVSVLTVRAGELDLSNASGRMIARMLGAAAQHESEHGAARRARKHREIAQEGGWGGGGRRPLGYEADGVTVHAAEAQVLREAAQRLLTGHSLTSTARWVSEELGRFVRPNVLRAALTAPRITGLRHHVPVEERRRLGDKARYDLSVGRLSEAQWEAVLDRETWGAVRAVLLDPDRKTTRQRDGAGYWLSNVVTCGRCGTPLNGSGGRYSCPVRSGGCGRLSGPQKGIEDFVEGELKAALAAQDVQVAVEAETEADPAAELRSRRDQVAALVATGVLGEDEGTAALDVLDAKIRAAQAQAGGGTARQAALVSALDAWDEADTAERRAAIRAVTESVVLDPAPAGGKSGSRFDTSRVRIMWA